MGIYYAKVTKFFSLANEECRIVMLGLDAAGKTTILYNLKLGETIETLPTIGFNVETLRYKKLDLTVWDVGGQDRIRNLWKHYYADTKGLIFVVDSQDAERIAEASRELEAITNYPEMQGVPVLIYANKQDMEGALKPNEIAERLALSRKQYKWCVQPACGVKGSGLYEGLDWLADCIMSKS
eukprot:TRINITY_DN3651_c0_g1_i1.p1 TRINITY_DN3651_c0_g1~~TRINITY_DN3651_c0_g1_i1.p1  ORF type:complete len:182 (+),score=34.14 TRINITY_DN3651_c0_g1_i1:151-696(+)